MLKFDAHQAVWNGCCWLCLSTCGQHFGRQCICCWGLVWYLQACAIFFEVLAARSLWVQWCARLEVWVFSCSLCCAWHRLSCPQARLPDWLAWVQGLVFVRKAQEVLRPWMGIRLSMARWDWIQEATCLCRRECACQVRWAVESSFGCTLHHPCLHPWWCGRMWCSPSSPVYPGKDKSFILSYFLECNTVLLIYCSFHLIFLSNG